MMPEESTETVTVDGYGKLIREWRCPFCHETVDRLQYIWCCEACGALFIGGLEFRYYDQDTGKEILELRDEFERVCGADA